MKKIVLALLASSFCVPVWSSNGSGQTVVVIDTGFDKNYLANYANRSACFSRQEFSTGQPKFNRTFVTPVVRKDTTTTDFIYNENIMSKCPNGLASQSGSNNAYAVNMPLRKKYRDVVSRNYRVVNSNPSLLFSTFDSYYSDVTVKHGTNVTKQVELFAPSAKVLPIVVGSTNRQRNCAVTGKTSEEYNQNLSDRYTNHFDKLIRGVGCGTATAQQVVDGLNYVSRNSSGVEYFTWVYAYQSMLHKFWFKRSIQS